MQMIQALPWVLSVALLILSVVLAINWLCTKFELNEMNELNSRPFMDQLYKKRETEARYDAKAENKVKQEFNYERETPKGEWV